MSNEKHAAALQNQALGIGPAIGQMQFAPYLDTERIHCLNEMAGNIWVTTSKGLYRVDGDKLTRIAFPE